MAPRLQYPSPSDDTELTPPTRRSIMKTSTLFQAALRLLDCSRLAVPVLALSVSLAGCAVDAQTTEDDTSPDTDDTMEVVKDAQLEAATKQIGVDASTRARPRKELSGAEKATRYDGPAVDPSKLVLLRSLHSPEAGAADATAPRAIPSVDERGRAIPSETEPSVDLSELSPEALAELADVGALDPSAPRVHGLVDLGDVMELPCTPGAANCPIQYQPKAY